MPHPLKGARALLTALMIVLAGGSVAVPAKAAFVPGTEDVPLAPGLTATGDNALVFDNPTGRIIQATATGTGDADAIARFYADTLPQLGWTYAPGGRWTRQAEILDITIQRQNGHISVRFQLAPRDLP